MAETRTPANGLANRRFDGEALYPCALVVSVIPAKHLKPKF